MLTFREYLLKNSKAIKELTENDNISKHPKKPSVKKVKQNSNK